MNSGKRWQQGKVSKEGLGNQAGIIRKNSNERGRKYQERNPPKKIKKK